MAKKTSAKKPGKPVKKNGKAGKSTLLVLMDTELYRKLQKKAKTNGLSLAAFTRKVMGKQVK